LIINQKQNLLIDYEVEGKAIR